VNAAVTAIRPSAPPLLLPSNRPLVRTDMFVLALAKIEAMTRLSTIGLIEGVPGTGKTTVIRYHAQAKGHRVTVIEIPPDSSSKVSLKHIHRGLTGYDHAGDKHDLQDALVRLLGVGGEIIVLDEAQHLGLAGIKQVRYLHDRCARETKPFTLVLGGHGVARAIARSKELDDRIKIRHTMKPIPTSALEKVFRQFHPRLTQADASLLLDIDTWAKGNLRRWGSLMDAVDLNDGLPEDGGPTGPITKPSVQRAFVLMGAEVRL
jgi:DNA transposition AAA+ family ATPase